MQRYEIKLRYANYGMKNLMIFVHISQNKTIKSEKGTEAPFSDYSHI